MVLEALMATGHGETSGVPTRPQPGGAPASGREEPNRARRFVAVQSPVCESCQLLQIASGWSQSEMPWRFSFFMPGTEGSFAQS